MNKIIPPLLIVILLAFIAFLILGILSGPRLFNDYERRTIKVGTSSYKLYIADSDQKRMRGLSGVQKMPQDQGMLFIMEQPDIHGFWMKDMKFPLDMIYLREQQVVDLKENVSPETYPQIIYPLAATDAVIELHTGEIQKSGIRIGDSITISK